MRLGRARGGGERALRPGAVRSARAARSGNPPPGPPRCSLGAGSARARQSAGKAGPGLPGRGLAGAATGAARGGGKRSGAEASPAGRSRAAAWKRRWPRRSFISAVVFKIQAELCISEGVGTRSKFLTSHPSRSCPMDGFRLSREDWAKLRLGGNRPSKGLYPLSVCPLIIAGFYF